MYYHVVIRTKDHQEYRAIGLIYDELAQDFVDPYMQQKPILVDSKSIDYEDIRHIQISSTAESLSQIIANIKKEERPSELQTETNGRQPETVISEADAIKRKGTDVTNEFIPEKQPGLFSHFGRGFAYFLISVSAFFAGYLLNDNNYSNNLTWHQLSSDLPIILTFAIMSFPFFIAYAASFHFLDPAKFKQGWLSIRDRVQAIAGAFGIAYVICGIIWLLKPDDTYHLLSKSLIVCILAYVAIFQIYAVYLFFRFSNINKGSDAQVREILIWPAIVAISFAFQYGFYFSKQKQETVFLIPMVIMVGWIMSSLIIDSILSKLGKDIELRKKVFRNYSFLLALGFASITLILTKLDITLWDDSLKVVFYSLAVTAYLSVFEAWRLSSNKAQQKRAKLIEQKKIFPELDAVGSRANSYSEIETYEKYYFASFLALVISTTLIPFVYIFTGFGDFFLLALFLFSVVSFSYWYWVGGQEKRLLGNKLQPTPFKVIIGFCFLTTLVIDTFIRSDVYINYGNWPVYFYFLEPIALAVIAMAMKPDGELRSAIFRRGDYKGFFCFRTRFPILVIEFSFLATLGTLALINVDSYSQKAFKTQILFVAYIILGLILLMFKEPIKEKTRYAVTAVVSILSTIRIFTSFVIGLAVVIPTLVKGEDLSRALFLALPFFLAAAGGFALNDFIDYKRDLINKPYRSIPSGRISRGKVLLVAIGFFILTALCIFLYNASVDLKMLQLAALVGVILYNPFVKYFGLGKTFYTGCLCSLPIFYDLVIIDYSLIYWLIPAAVILFIVGREILMDILDIKGDAATGIRTLPMIFGTKLSRLMSYVMQSIAAILLLPVAIGQGNMVAVILALGTLIIVQIINIAWIKATFENKKILIKLAWLPMIMGLSLMFI